MSKIEKALSKAQAERTGLQLVPLPDAAARTAAGTALLLGNGGRPETIARMAASETRLRDPADLRAHGIIQGNQPADAAVQAFRELRTRINQQGGGQSRVILVTGVRKRSGSTFVARNLAAAFAFDSVRTALVIDCNFRNPSAHRLIVNPAAKGLTDYLAEPDSNIGEIIHPVGIARMRVIPAGRAGALQMEHFNSPRMAQLIDALRHRYMERFIILDGPSMSEAADVHTLSQYADHVLLVARYGQVTGAQIEDCARLIGGGREFGVVLNDEPRVPWFR